MKEKDEKVGGWKSAVSVGIHAVSLPSSKAFLQSCHSQKAPKPLSLSSVLTIGAGHRSFACMNNKRPSAIVTLLYCHCFLNKMEDSRTLNR